MNTRTDMAHEAQRRCPELAGVEEENESRGQDPHLPHPRTDGGGGAKAG